MGTYRSAAPAADADAPSGVPDGDGDFDGDGEHAGYAYSGGWRLGRPRGVGWWRYGGSGVYAGEVDDGWHHGRGAYWGADGQRCFEGEWARGYAVGDGAMRVRIGELMRSGCSNHAASRIGCRARRPGPPPPGSGPG